MSVLEVDAGHKALSGLCRTFGQIDLTAASEAETRFQVIDRVLETVLGWNKEDVAVEERVSEDGETTYADYLLSTASTQLVVEAKKAGETFPLPPRRQTLRLGGVLTEGKLGEAIRQARDYCRKLSVPFAVVTNGSAWVIFPAVRIDGISFEKGTARIFRDLDDVQRRFVEFWELLSRQRVLDGNLQSLLLGERADPNEARSMLELLAEPGYRLGRNAVYDLIEPAVAAALSDEALLLDSEALRACYVKTSERFKYDSRLRMFLADSLPSLGHPTTRVRSRKKQDAVAKELESAPARPPRLLLVLGPVGAGKTTFLEYTRSVSAADVVGKEVMWLGIDYKKSTVEDNPRDFLHRELLGLVESDEDFDLGDWERTIRPAYKDEINRLRRGPLYLLSKQSPDEFDRQVVDLIAREREAVAPYLERVLGYAVGQRPGYLVIDNVDQLDDAEIQARIFLEAQAFARRTGLNLIISLRESTYLRLRSSPVFDAFQFDSFYVDPPLVLPVLSRRFGYAQRVLAGKSAELVTEGGMRVPVQDLSVFFDLVSKSVLDDETGFMLESLAGGDIRRGLSLVRSFLSSGHTNADRALAAYLKQGDYHFPAHEVFKGAVLGPMKYFRDEVALLPNLYDAKLSSHGLQLLRLRIVERLVKQAGSAGFDGIPVADLTTDLGRLGVAPTEAHTVLETLFSKRVIRTRSGTEVTPDSVILPTRLAGYCLRVLCCGFAYNEQCSLDTVVFDDSTWSQLEELTGEIEALRDPYDKLELRVDRLKVWLEYVARAEAKWIVECNRRDLEGPWGRSIVKSLIVPSVEAALEGVLKSGKRRFGRKHVRTSGTSILDESERGGRIVSTWPDREYVFIEDTDGVDWFSHKKDFASATDWNRRAVDLPCLFRAGEFHGKPRAAKVQVIHDEHGSSPRT